MTRQDYNTDIFVRLLDFSAHMSCLGRWHDLRAELTQVLANDNSAPASGVKRQAHDDSRHVLRTKSSSSKTFSSLRSAFLKADAEVHAKARVSTLRTRIQRLENLAENSSSDLHSNASASASSIDSRHAGPDSNRTSHAKEAGGEINGSSDVKPGRNVSDIGSHERTNSQAMEGGVSAEVEKFRDLVASTEESIRSKKQQAARQLGAAQRLQDALYVAQEVSFPSRRVTALPALKYLDQCRG